jgi:hypothetical protein
LKPLPYSRGSGSVNLHFSHNFYNTVTHVWGYRMVLSAQ